MGKSTKRRSLEPHTECHAETKNESIYFSLFTLYFWLARKKKKKQFRGHSFSPFSSSTLKTGLANALAAPRRSRKKEKHSNICRRFQTDSWDVNNSTLSLPWPLENKGEMPSRGAGSPGAGPVSGIYCPPPGESGAIGAPSAAYHHDCHSCRTKMRNPRREAQERNINSKNAPWAIKHMWMQSTGIHTMTTGVKQAAKTFRINLSFK